MISTTNREFNGPKSRILFDGSVLANGSMDGIRRYTLELLKAMVPLVRERDRPWEIHVSVDGFSTWPLQKVATLLELETLASLSKCEPQGRPTLIGEVGRFANRLKRSVVKRLPIRRAQFDVLHLPLPNSYALYRNTSASLVMTVHDLCHVVCPEYQLPINIESLRNGLEHAIGRNAKLIADSRSTANDLERYAHVPPERINTVHLACNRDRFRPVQASAEKERVRAKYKLPSQPFLLSLCTLEPRKNLLGAVRAFRALEESGHSNGCHLVLAGRAGWGDQERILTEAASDRVHLVGRVDDEDLPVLYSMGLAFLCMSYYEGFCLPLLEAMSCGCPVVHSDRSAMPEVAGDAGLQASPDDSVTITQRLRELVHDAELREKMRTRGLIRAEQFSWGKAAEQVLNTYQECLEARSRNTQFSQGSAVA